MILVSGNVPFVIFDFEIKPRTVGFGGRPPTTRPSEPAPG